MLSENFCALLILIIGFMLTLIVIASGRWLKKRAKKTSSRLDDIILSAVGKPLILSIAVITIYSSLSTCTLIPESLHWILDSRYLRVVMVLIGSWIIWSFVRTVTNQYEDTILINASNEAALKFYYFFKGTFGYFLFVVAIIFILRILEIDVTPILAAGGIAALGISFAAKDVIENFLSGAILAADQPFHIGDRIAVQEYVGEVISIGPRSTRIQTLDFQLVTIPNTMLTNEVVTNFALPDTRMKIRVNIGVAYGSDIPTVKKILLDLASEAVTKGLCISEPSPSVYLLKFSESSMDLQLITWTDQYSLIWDVQDYINCRMLEEFKKHNIEIPFPQIDVHMKDTKHASKPPGNNSIEKRYPNQEQ